MTLQSMLQTDLTAALKARDSRKAQVLRMLLSEITYARTASQPANEEKAAQRYHKKLLDTRSFLSADDPRRNEVDVEIALVESYLPKEPDKNEVKNYVMSLDLTQPFGLVMKAAKAKFPDANGKVLKELIESLQVTV